MECMQGANMTKLSVFKMVSILDIGGKSKSDQAHWLGFICSCVSEHGISVGNIHVLVDRFITFEFLNNFVQILKD